MTDKAQPEGEPVEVDNDEEPAQPEDETGRPAHEPGE